MDRSGMNGWLDVGYTVQGLLDGLMEGWMDGWIRVDGWMDE